MNVIQLPWHCHFESDLCGMIQRTNDQFDWTRRSGETLSIRTEPNKAALGEWYIYIETTSPHRNCDVAVEVQMYNHYF